MLRRDTLPRLWPWLLPLLTSTAIWMVVAETLIRPESLILESTPMLQRSAWWILPPLLVISLLFGGVWAFKTHQRNVADEQDRQQAAAQKFEQEQAEQAAANTKAHQQFTLEIRGVGITVDRFRQMKIWQRLDEVNNPWQNILSQDAESYAWSDGERDLINGQRANKTFSNTLGLWVERWPIPVLVVDSDPSEGRGLNQINRAENGSVAAIHLFTGAGAHSGDGGEVLVEQLFKLFDDNPTLPAAVLLGLDSQQFHPPYGRNEKFVPKLPDSIVGILVTRTDRVDQYIRPYVVDVPYDINKLDTQYDVIKLWNAYFDAEKEYRKTPKAFSTMPTAYWNEKVKTLIGQIDPNANQGNMTPFWQHAKEGFKPTPWLPVRWTKWQLEDADRAPLLGYLHRPVEVTLNGDVHQQTQSMTDGWKAALATLPEGQAPQWLFYDTAGNDKRIIPFSSAMALPDTPHKLDFSDAQHSYNLSRRVADTGAASPFAQLALATMRSYDKGGVSATLNLRQDGRASIIMVSPPNEKQKKKNRPNPYNGGEQPDSTKPFDPFFEVESR